MSSQECPALCPDNNHHPVSYEYLSDEKNTETETRIEFSSEHKKAIEVIPQIHDNTNKCPTNKTDMLSWGDQKCYQSVTTKKRKVGSKPSSTAKKAKMLKSSAQKIRNVGKNKTTNAKICRINRSRQNRMQIIPTSRSAQKIAKKRLEKKRKLRKEKKCKTIIKPVQNKKRSRSVSKNDRKYDDNPKNKEISKLKLKRKAAKEQQMKLKLRKAKLKALERKMKLKAIEKKLKLRLKKIAEKKRAMQLRLKAKEQKKNRLALQKAKKRRRRRKPRLIKIERELEVQEGLHDNLLRYLTFRQARRYGLECCRHYCWDDWEELDAEDVVIDWD